MSDNTVNFKTEDGTLGAAGGAWTEVLTGAFTNSSDIEVRAGRVEYIVGTASSTPSTTLMGKLLSLTETGTGESQVITSIDASKAIFARAIGNNQAVLVVTPASS